MTIKKVARDLTPPIAWRLLLKLRRENNSLEPQRQPAPGELSLQKKRASVRGIFMHIHKCAGTSLIEAFERRPEVISCVARPGNFPGRTGRERIPDEVWNHCVKFTFVRNPYDRIISAYRMFSKSEPWRSLFPAFSDFVEFLRWANVHDHCVEDETPIGEYVKTVGNIIHHCSSYQNSKYLIDQMDFIGHLENFQEDLDRIAQSMDIKLPDVSHLNKSSGRNDYREYYSAKTREIVHDIYRADIERFDYSF